MWKYMYPQGDFCNVIMILYKYHHVMEVFFTQKIFYLITSITWLWLMWYFKKNCDHVKQGITATCLSWFFPESNFLYSGDPIRYNQFNCISRLAKPSFVLLIFWKCKTEISELGLNKFLWRYYQKWTKVAGYLLPSLRRCGIE